MTKNIASWATVAFLVFVGYCLSEPFWSTNHKANMLRSMAGEQQQRR
jgi:hypothetical protein